MSRRVEVIKVALLIVIKRWFSYCKKLATILIAERLAQKIQHKRLITQDLNPTLAIESVIVFGAILNAFGESIINAIQHPRL
jgi:hypothetical protein